MDFLNDLQIDVVSSITKKYDTCVILLSHYKNDTKKIIQESIKKIEKILQIKLSEEQISQIQNDSIKHHIENDLKN